jgi:hypothetical protein
LPQPDGPTTETNSPSCTARLTSRNASVLGRGVFVAQIGDLKQGGVPCPPHASTEAAIDTFEATAACLGAGRGSSGRWRIYAPYGLADVFNLVVRPNPVLAPRHVYQAKAARWSRQWPGLTVLPWPEPSASRG